MGLAKFCSNGHITLEIECKVCGYTEEFFLTTDAGPLWHVLIAGFHPGQNDTADLHEEADEEFDAEECGHERDEDEDGDQEFDDSRDDANESDSEFC